MQCKWSASLRDSSERRPLHLLSRSICSSSLDLSCCFGVIAVLFDPETHFPHFDVQIADSKFRVVLLRSKRSNTSKYFWHSSVAVGN